MDFKTACEKARAFTKKPTDEDYLEFYGLYKQATVGDVNIAEPTGEDAKAKAKWAAWNKLKGTKLEDAKKSYVAVYEKYAPKYA